MHFLVNILDEFINYLCRFYSFTGTRKNKICTCESCHHDDIRDTELIRTHLQQYIELASILVESANQVHLHVWQNKLSIAFIEWFGMYYIWY